MPPPLTQALPHSTSPGMLLPSCRQCWRLPRRWSLWIWPTASRWSAPQRMWTGWGQAGRKPAQPLPAPPAPTRHLHTPLNTVPRAGAAQDLTERISVSIAPTRNAWHPKCTAVCANHVLPAAVFYQMILICVLASTIDCAVWLCPCFSRLRLASSPPTYQCERLEQILQPTVHTCLSERAVWTA